MSQSGLYYGCDSTDAFQGSCSSTAYLSDDDFTYGGSTYTFNFFYFYSFDSQLQLALAASPAATFAEIKTALSSLTLYVDGAAFVISDAEVYASGLRWPFANPGWADSSTASLSLVESPRPSTSAPPPPPSNFARSDVQWSPDGGTHPVPVRLSEIRSVKPHEASGSLDLSAIAASVREEVRPHSRGFYLTVLVDSAADRRYLFRSGAALDSGGAQYERASGAPLLKVQIWHIYHHTGRGWNTVELLGDVFVGRAGDRLAEPARICLPAPTQEAERARIAVRGRLDRHWTILDSDLTSDGRLCADTTRVAWFTIVLEPESEEAPV